MRRADPIFQGVDNFYLTLGVCTMNFVRITIVSTVLTSLTACSSAPQKPISHKPQIQTPVEAPKKQVTTFRLIANLIKLPGQEFTPLDPPYNLDFTTTGGGVAHSKGYGDCTMDVPGILECNFAKVALMDGGIFVLNDLEKGVLLGDHWTTF